MAAPQDRIDAGSIGHASSDETSLMMHLHPQTPDLRQLPPQPTPLRYTQFAIVDGPGFDGKGPADRAVPSGDDPRVMSDARRGGELFEDTVGEITAEIEHWIMEGH
jgi:creatinine amidohydrolase/Fe(II)-dependent formamide hydrolase-like protein